MWFPWSFFFYIFLTGKVYRWWTLQIKLIILSGNTCKISHWQKFSPAVHVIMFFMSCATEARLKPTRSYATFHPVQKMLSRPIKLKHVSNRGEKKFQPMPMSRKAGRLARNSRLKSLAFSLWLSMRVCLPECHECKRGTWHFQ